MHALYRVSIRRKLILLFTATASVSVLIACAALWTYQFVHHRTSLQTEESATAQLLADSSAPALLFNDATAANETLAVLRADPRIQTACLYDKWGSVVAQFNPGTKAAVCPPISLEETSFTRSHLLIFRQITIREEAVGNLYIEVSLAEMYASVLHFGETGICVLLVTTVFAFSLSSILQRIISEPIIHLTRVATQVSDQGNYLLRAKSFSEDETGLLIGQFNAMMDNIQQREADLQQAHATLEDTVKMRTIDLRTEIAERKQIECDLVAAKSAAEESNRAKSSFLATMSHELRTPLNAIIGYSEMLWEDAQSAGEVSTSDDLGKILDSARHLLSLISDVLDFSKIEAGQMNMHPELVLISSLLHDVLPTAEILARRNCNKLHVNEPIADGWLLVDSIRFRQCLLNLLSNACKFTENGAISIRVEQQPMDGKNWILWSISDTGVGIAPNMLGKLFQTFSQVDSTLTRKFGGSGLGLVISQQFCRAMGGYITVESEPRVGSTFTIYIPGCPEPLEEILNPKDSSDLQNAGVRGLSG
jgi:signal transduction histidine kinase